MVRSMMSLADLPLSFWGYVLETATFTLNRAPSKSVETASYEPWFGKKPKLSFLKVWGCDAYVKRLQPEKLEPKRTNASSQDTQKRRLGTPSISDPKAKCLSLRTGHFSRKSFSRKN